MTRLLLFAVGFWVGFTVAFVAGAWWATRRRPVPYRLTEAGERLARMDALRSVAAPTIPRQRGTVTPMRRRVP